MKKWLFILIAVIGFLAVSLFVLRLYTKSFSPAANAEIKSGELNVKVAYSQPQKKGRKIFGGLVPYGKVWRTGANEATEITFSKAAKLNGQPIAAGTYTLFTIPNEDKWTIILNSVTGQWGAFTHKPDKDVMRTEVPANNQAESVEKFTIHLQEAEGTITMTLHWDQTAVKVPITQ